MFRIRYVIYSIRYVSSLVNHMSYNFKGQTDMFYSDEEVDQIKAKATGNGAAIGFIIGFGVALMIFATIGVFV